jgi:hypothetical protein
MKKIIIFILIGFALSLNPIAEAAEKHFNLTSKQFISRYNQSMQTLNAPWLIAKEIEKNAKNITTTSLSINKNLGLILTANKNNKKINCFVLIGAIDRKIQSGLNIIFGILASIMATEDPFLPISERNKILVKLASGVKTGTVEFIRKNIQYNFFQSDISGVMFTAAPN